MCVCVYMFSTEVKVVCVCVFAVTREDGALLAPVREREKSEEGGFVVLLFRFTSLCFTGPAGPSGDVATPPELSQNVAENGF